VYNTQVQEMRYQEARTLGFKKRTLGFKKDYGVGEANQN